ncbi:hypothetical protein B0H13DRAFT_2307121 [Mycena leptocephala]|nr:hypothetical protein B0H13DRAFT_2307121 [Mycena leptocephala]
MRRIESSYYELERLRNTPLSLPNWVDPTYPLFISTSAIPVGLLPYKPVFREHLATLMRDCGFNAHQGALQNKFVCFNIHFPARTRVAAQDLAGLSQILNVQDEFSTMQTANMASPNEHEPGSSTFSATDFERLMSRGVQGSDTTVGDPSDGAEEFLLPRLERLWISICSWRDSEKTVPRDGGEGLVQMIESRCYLDLPPSGAPPFAQLWDFCPKCWKPKFSVSLQERLAYLEEDGVFRWWD